MSNHAYYALTAESITLGRDPVTSLSTEPAHTYNIIWNMDLNTALNNTAQIRPPRQLDAEEKYHVPGTVNVGNNWFKYTLSTGALTIDLEATKDESKDPQAFTITYATVTGTGSTEALALAILAKKLSTDGTQVTILAGDDSDLSKDVGSGMSPLLATRPSSGVDFSLSDGTQTIKIAEFLVHLKYASGAHNWYNANAYNNQSVSTQVRTGLAKLFDRDPQLNNLLGSSSTASAFLDTVKVQNKLQLITDDFYTRIFSPLQLEEVLEAVADRGSNGVLVGEAYNTWNFQPGDSISAVVRIIDSDSTATSTMQNSDRWMITLQHRQPAPK